MIFKDNVCSPVFKRGFVFAGLGTMYVRYKQVQALISASESVLQLMNYAGLLLGIFSSVGMCVVANFQVTQPKHRRSFWGLGNIDLCVIAVISLNVFTFFQKTDIISVHLLGAGLTFGPGTLYILVQNAMSFRMQPRFHGKDMLWARMAVASWSLISIITCILLYVLFVK